MHLAEGTLPFSHALLWTGVSVPLLIWSVRGELAARRKNPASSTLMAGCSSLLFAATLFPLPVPVVGATSHICFTPLVALLLGVRRTIWPTFFVLLLQALFFAHGGLTTLGVNTLTLGVVGPTVAVACLWVSKALRVPPLVALGVSCFWADLCVYFADAGVLAIGLGGLAPFQSTVAVLVAGFAPVQLPLALLEGFVSVALVRTLTRRRPDFLPQSLKDKHSVVGKSVLMALLVLPTLLSTSACSYQGIDGSVFGSTAERSGFVPSPSSIDLSQGEVGLAANILVLFTLGFVAGRAWEKSSGGRDASSR